MTNPHADRYAKQTRFARIGESGQQRLAASSVMLCGCGALGSVIADQLVRAGVGRLTLVDRDFVEHSNLQRQVLFTEADAADHAPKAIAGAERLRQVNSTVRVDPVIAHVSFDNLPSLAEGHDLLLDGTDNFETRLLLNDYAVRESKPWVYGGVIGAEGRVMPIVPSHTACLACLLPTPPSPGETETCDSAGVLAPTVGVVGSLQAAEAIKLLVGASDDLTTGLTVIDLWTGRWRRLDVPADADCRACARRDFPWLDGRSGSRAVVLCGRNAVQLSPPPGAPTVDLQAMLRKLAPLGNARASRHMLRLRHEAHEITLFADGRTIISGVDDESHARSVWTRCFGG